jgi:curli biogenesis system outer membrane secretion channel CsgG
MLAFFAGAGWSQVPAMRRVAVFDFDNAAVQGTISSSNFHTHSPAVGKSVSELLITKLVKDGNVIVVERSAIDKVLGGEPAKVRVW